jgi:thiol-disulfide isomerase/thioredoxin
MRPRFSLLTLPALAALAGACVAGPHPDARAPAATNMSAVELRGVDGGAAPLATAIGHRPALVSFWAPWCDPCVRELPELERLARAVAPCGGSVVGVAVGERPQTIASFTRARGLTYAQFTDEQFRLADALGQRRIPATVVVDGDARVLFAGDALDDRARAALTRALGGAAGCALR